MTSPLPNIAEEWRAIPQFEGLYEVSDRGRIRSLDRLASGSRAFKIKGRVLSPGRTRKGYLSISLHKNGRAYPREVHRIVCRAFHGEPVTPDLEAAHRDGDPSNAAATNLRWATRKENHADKKRHGTHLVGAAVPNSRLTDDKARDIFTRAHAGEGIRRLGREFGVGESLIRQIRDGLVWAHATLALRNHLQQELPE